MLVLSVAKTDARKLWHWKWFLEFINLFTNATVPNPKIKAPKLQNLSHHFHKCGTNDNVDVNTKPARLIVSSKWNCNSAKTSRALRTKSANWHVETPSVSMPRVDGNINISGLQVRWWDLASHPVKWGYHSVWLFGLVWLILHCNLLG